MPTPLPAPDPPKTLRPRAFGVGVTSTLFIALFVAVALVEIATSSQPRWPDYNICASIGAAVGAAELLSRYKDSPRRLFAMPSTWAYVMGNGLAAGLALLLVSAFNWDFGLASGREVRVAQVVVAGTGAMLVLRSSLANVEVDGESVPAGPALLISSLLDSIERVIDRNQARYRSADVGAIMVGISSELAATGLVEHVILLLESPSKEKAAELGENAAEIAAKPTINDQIKAYNMGLLLLKYAGAEVLRSAVETLHAEIKCPPALSHNNNHAHAALTATSAVLAGPPETHLG